MVLGQVQRGGSPLYIILSDASHTSNGALELAYSVLLEWQKVPQVTMVHSCATLEGQTSGLDATNYSQGSQFQPVPIVPTFFNCRTESSTSPSAPMETVTSSPPVHKRGIALRQTNSAWQF